MSRNRRAAFLAVMALAVGLVLPGFVAPSASNTDPEPPTPPVGVGPDGDYVGPYFGKDNFPPGCTRDNKASNPANGCHRIVTGLNALDSPRIDVLVMVPASPTAERDMRIMRQSIEMWEGGIELLARRMGLDWLADGVDLAVTVDHVDLEGGEPLSLRPAVDPEIVVIAANPTGGAGIGVDPLDFAARVGLIDDGDAPCHPVANPFDFDAWAAAPGFDSHHGTRSGTYYVEDCGGEGGQEGGGGNVCFAVNGAIDPAPSQTEDGEHFGAIPFGLFDLVSHEVGHCLTLGHVGDGGEALLGNGWGKVPTADIMSYDLDPAERYKCVSTLDVEAFALRMSRYLDVDGDGDVDDDDVLEPNDQVGSPDGLNPLQVQHPQNHFYASATGDAVDCPQPDVGEVPGERTDWMPETTPATEAVLALATPEDGAVAHDGRVLVTGDVERRRVDGQPRASTPPPPPPPPPYSGTLTFERSGTFEVEQSTLGVTNQVEATDPSHHHVFDLTNADVAVELRWRDLFPLPPASDLDLFVTATGPGEPVSSGTTGATSSQPERVNMTGIGGRVEITVTPTFVNTLTTYTLRIVITPRDGAYGGLTPPDVDLDGVLDDDDACPHHPGIGADGCTPPRLTEVRVSVDGVVAGSTPVDADHSPDSFSVPVAVGPGTHAVDVDWVDGGRVVASRSVSVDGPEPPPDADGDGVADGDDSCPTVPNADQGDVDGDGLGDVCDDDIDGDGYSNEREVHKGSDPYDPASTPKTDKGKKPKKPKP